MPDTQAGLAAASELLGAFRHDGVLESDRFQQIIVDLAAQTGRPEADIRAEVKVDLEEMEVKHNKLATDAWNMLAAWMGRAYSLDVDQKALAHLHELNREHSLIFLPNHRSYLDPLVLRSALDEHGFPHNNVLGGVNLAFWPMSTIARRNGIVFIRREFKGDPVYRAVLRGYLAYLVEHQANLEWYIEGGRTRTGKLRPPRYGILSYVVDAFDAGTAEDVYLVPTSIIYDQQHEVEAISAEEAGGTKSPESIGWLIEYARSQSRRLGKAHLRFGEPLSLREALAESNDETGQRNARLAVQKVAFEVCHRINEATPVTPTALLTFALLDNDDRALTLGEGRVILAPLLDYVTKRGLPVTADMDLSRTGTLRDPLLTLIREGVVERFGGGTEPVYHIPREKQHEAAFYRNTVIHFFITRAIVEIALVKAAEDAAEDVQTATWEEARRMRDLLKFEFFFPRTRVFAERVAEEVDIVHPGWRDETFARGDILPMLSDVRPHLAHRVLAPFLDAYAVCADRLAVRDPGTPLDTDAFLEECLGVAQQKWLQRELHSPESISKDLFKGALKLAENRGLTEAGQPGLQERRDAFAAELADANRRVGVIRMMSYALDRDEEFA